MLNKFQAQVLDRRSCVLQRRHRRHRRQRRRRRCDGQEEGQQDLPPAHDQPLVLGLWILGLSLRKRIPKKLTSVLYCPLFTCACQPV